MSSLPLLSLRSLTSRQSHSLPGPASRGKRYSPSSYSLSNLSWWSLLKYGLPLTLFSVCRPALSSASQAHTGAQLWLVHYMFEVHIELAFYRRGWVASTMEKIEPLSGTCFPPLPSYDLSLAEAPKHFEVHAGLAMRLGSDCYDFASLIPLSPLPEQRLPKHTIFHLYWRGDLRPIEERQILLLQSLLSTQDADSSTIVLWSNRNLIEASEELASLQERHPDRFVVRIIDIPALARGTPMEGSPRLAAAEDARAWVDGDLVRVLVLWSEGGVWVDMDHLVLRDLRPLLEHEWVTQWDCYGACALLFFDLMSIARLINAQRSRTKRSTAP